MFVAPFSRRFSYAQKVRNYKQMPSNKMRDFMH